MKSKFKKDHIKIIDWAGNILFQGHYEDKKVLSTMRRNKAPNDDIFVSWLNENDSRNVYEFIYF